jgi:transcriptional regulator with XRE-family HTH domain
MSRGRRSGVLTEADRRAREQRAQLGGEIRSSRLRRRWTQQHLAELAGVDRQIVGRIERARTRLDVDVLQRIGVALNRYLEIRFGRDAMEQPADAGHLAMQELVLRLGRANGFIGEFEVPTRPAEPWRSIDVVLASRPRRLMILNECWNTFGDIGAAARATVRKTAELEALATGRWGPDARVRVVWIVRATARNRALLGRYPEIFASRFSGSSRAWVRALTEGSEPPTEPGLVWCDVAATRLLEWRRRS